MRFIHWLALALLLLSGCIPARLPDNFHHTPGAPAVITTELYRGAAFSVRYPAGWRVILGAAAASPAVTFVAPDDCALILISTDLAADLPALTGCEGAIIREGRQLTVEGEALQISGIAAGGNSAAFAAAFMTILRSLTASP